MTISTIQEVSGLLICDLIFARTVEGERESLTYLRSSICTFLCFYVQRKFEDTGYSSPFFLTRKCDNLKSINYRDSDQVRGKSSIV